MPADYNKILEKVNLSRYKIPDGWDSREVIAKQIGCDPSRVREVLKPAIEAGLIEAKSFSVYNPSSRSVPRVMAYRPVPEKKAK